MKVVVAGAGIGGLCAAIALTKVGFEVEVIERAPALTEVGAGIQLSPNAVKGLAGLGVLEAVLAVASQPLTLEMRIGRTGEKVFSIPIAKDARKRYEAPYIHVHRADLIEILRRAANFAGVQLRLNARVSAYVREDTGLKIGLDNGMIVGADLLIGADGSRSTVRKQMLGEDQARYTGAVAWRLTVPADVAPDLPHSAIVWAGPGKHAVTYRVRRGELINFVGVVETERWREESWTQPGDLTELAADFGGWAPPIPDILAAADGAHVWALFDRDPLPRWSDDRVTLLGDACHAMPPFQAQGAAMAIEDAIVLAKCLQAEGVSPASLLKYEKLRKPRTSRVLNSARSNMGVFHRSNAWSQAATYGPMKVADKLFPAFIRSRQDWIYGYDVRKVVV
ncbi:MAG: monooxygenase [Sphingomonadales bacterium]|nr:MAG: monooxygenase [Sphingomonadales bacterium]